MHNADTSLCESNSPGYWPFTPIPRSDYTICMSGQLPAFRVPRPFGAEGTRWQSEPCPVDSRPVALAGRPPHKNGQRGYPPASCPRTVALLQSPKQRMVNTVGSFEDPIFLERKYVFEENCDTKDDESQSRQHRMHGEMGEIDILHFES